ncbi:putative regulatory protein [Streptomyces sp. Tu6071]|nr:putative regulatory protein [Streptomyces sp. Tu6071]
MVADRDDEEPRVGFGGPPPVPHPAAEVERVPGAELVDAALGLGGDRAVGDVEQRVVAVLELAARVVVAAVLHGLELVLAPHERAHAGGRGHQCGVLVVAADDVHGVRGVGGGEQLVDGRLQRVRDGAQGAGGGAGAFVLDLAEEGHRETRAAGHGGEREFEGAPATADGVADPRGFLLVHRCRSLLRAPSTGACEQPTQSGRARGAECGSRPSPERP